MTKTVELCFDVISPAAYIAWNILPKIAEAAGAEIQYTPIFLGGVMQATGNRPPGTVAAKGAWMNRDFARWCEMYELPYKRNSVFPQMTLTAMRGAVAYQEQPVFLDYITALYRALHEEDRDIQQPEVMGEILGDLGIDGTEFMARIGDQSIKDKLKTNTENAVERGVFGAPSFFIGDTMHWGQDRLFMVAQDLGTSIHDALAD
ncbi:MAG: 2-hydroxychromene-2-carboxylate isomerase [Pseudomonadota bacterium]